MNFIRQYRGFKNSLKIRVIIWLTSFLSYKYNIYKATGIFNPENDASCMGKKVLQETTEVPVPCDLYDRTAKFMRRDPYDNKLKAIPVSSEGSVWQVPQGRIYTNRTSQFFVLSREGKILPSVSYQYEDAIAGRAEEDVQLFARFFPEPIKISGRVVNFVLGGGVSINISHWMMDGLARIKLLEEMYPVNEIDTFVVQGKGAPNWIESLTLLGIDESKIRVFDQQLIHIQGEEIIAMTHPRGRLSNVTPKWVIDFLREKYLPVVPDKSDGWPEKIYISRKDSSLRGMLNEDEVLGHLHQQGYVELILSSLSFAEKVGYFYHAKEIIGMSGAGFGFLAFCKPSARVIELFPSGFVHYVNCVVAKQVGMDYRYLVFGNTDADQGGYGAQREELVVDIQQLKQTLVS